MSSRENRKATLRCAFTASIPVMTGYLVLGIGFGVLLENAGFHWIWALLMSLIIYAGSMQYVTVQLLSSGATLLTAAIMTVMVNVRHLFYSITMVEKYRGVGASKPYLIFSLTDETYSLVCSPELPLEVSRKKYYLYLSALNHFYWVFGSVFGAVVGKAIPFDSTGIEFAMTALFTVIFISQWEQTKNHLSAFCGVWASVLCLYCFDTSDFLIPSLLLILLLVFAFRPYMEKNPLTVSGEESTDKSSVSEGGNGNGR